ncbi:MAG: ribose 5-phosphate isomerase B [Planctomycetota bacterium]|nr:ribose 5-phosphate isomerase B [Planctomycetota bacterium]
MKIAVAADHAGFEYKERCKGLLARLGHSVEDVGTHSTESVDYPDFAYKAAGLVAGGACERAVLVCGSGIGMCIAANKVRGIRAAVGNDDFSARMSRAHNNTNVLCIGSRIIPPEKMETLVTIWLDTAFEGGRHERRVAKLTNPA